MPAPVTPPPIFASASTEPTSPRADSPSPTETRTDEPWKTVSTPRQRTIRIKLTTHAHERLCERLSVDWSHGKALVFVADAIEAATASGELIPHAIAGQSLARMVHDGDEVFAVFKPAAEDAGKQVVMTVLTRMQLETLFGMAVSRVRGERW